MIMIAFNSANMMPLIVRQWLIEHVVLLADVHSKRPLLHTPAFGNVQYRLTPLLDHQLSLETQKIPDLHKAKTVTVCLVSQSFLQVKWRLTFSPGFPMAPASVAVAVADVFSKNGHSIPNKFDKILKIFDRLDDVKSRGVMFFT